MQRCWCKFLKGNGALTRWGRVTHIYVWTTYQHCFRQWLVALSAPSHYLNQCWNFVNSKFGNKFQWNLKRNSCIFIYENAFQNVICEMAAILSRPQCINEPELKTICLSLDHHIHNCMWTKHWKSVTPFLYPFNRVNNTVWYGLMLMTIYLSVIKQILFRYSSCILFHWDWPTNAKTSIHAITKRIHAEKWYLRMKQE